MQRDALTVYVVTGEYCFSENGEVAWLDGVYRTVEAARVGARLDAETQEGRRCLVDGEPYGANWGCECEGPEHRGDCDADPSDWDVSFEIHAEPVQD